MTRAFPLRHIRGAARRVRAALLPSRFGGESRASLNRDAAPLCPALPTVFVVGDSTAHNLDTEGAKGWGEALAPQFDESKINVVNAARAGRSSRSFLAEGRWDAVLEHLKPGDFVLLQMGHNDHGAVEAPFSRASLPGLGAESVEITGRNGARETVHTYGHNMRRFIGDARAKGALPILLSLTVRNLWTDGKVERGYLNLNAWISEIADTEGVPLVDATGLIADLYDSLGPDVVRALFAGDIIHTNAAGADANAACIVAGLKSLSGQSLAAFFKGQTGLSRT